MERRVEFNALPIEIRERLVGCLGGGGAPKPVLAEPTKIVGGAIGFGLLAGLGGLIVLGLAANRFGHLAWGIQSGNWAYYALGYGVLVLGVGLAYRRVLLGKSLPYKPGRYLLPLDFVEAKGTQLRVIPMGELSDFKGTHHHTNGIYTHTALTLTFGRRKENFSLRSKHKADSLINELRMGRARLLAALESQDPGQLVALDPFFEVRAADSWDSLPPPDPHDADDPLRAEPLPAWLGTPVVLGAAALAGILLGPLTQSVRNHLSDGAMFAEANRRPTVSNYQTYLGHGKRFTEEVRTDLLPQAELDAAVKAKSVADLQRILVDYPDSIHEVATREAIHTLFLETLEVFRSHANLEDPQLMTFMEALIAYLEREGSPNVHVRFAPPSADDLKRVDMANQAGIDSPGSLPVRVAPCASHFDEDSSLGRERAIVQLLAKGFQRVFPTDILVLSQGERLTEEASRRAVSVPSLDIHYAIRGSGDYYYEEANPSRAFVGIVVTFQASMRIPGESEALEFDLQVVPPEHFQVQYQGSRFAGFDPRELGFTGGGASDTLVYQVMALRAFDELVTKLEGVFFKPSPEGDDPFGVQPR